MMNKRGGIGLTIIVAITIFIIGMTSLNLLMPEVTTTRGATSLDCTNSSISDGTKLTCLTVDLAIPYFIILVFSVAGGVLVDKFT